MLYLQKRPPMPHSTSGSSSPFHAGVHSIGPESPPLPPPPPHSTPTHSSHHLTTYSHPNGHLVVHSSHAPSRLSKSVSHLFSDSFFLLSHYMLLSRSSQHSPSSSTYTSTIPSPAATPSPPSSPGPATPPALHVTGLPAPSTAGGETSSPDVHAPVPKASLPAGHPRAHFLTTLQSKSAWDAMVHGSWM